MKKYEYKFVRIDVAFLPTEPKEDYQKKIREQAQDGWRLVQIFSPMITRAFFGSRIEFYELIFEREL